MSPEPAGCSPMLGWLFLSLGAFGLLEVRRRLRRATRPPALPRVRVTGVKTREAFPVPPPPPTARIGWGAPPQ